MPFSAPAWLTPDFRYAGDDWTGDNALLFTVYGAAPVFAADGVTVLTPGVPRDLTGYTVSGTLRLQSPSAPGLDPTHGSATPIPTGTLVDPAGGVIALSLPAGRTQQLPRQPYGLSDPSQALLIVQPRVVGPQGAVTVGLQQIFVF